MNRAVLTVCSLRDWKANRSDVNFMIVRKTITEIEELPNLSEVAPTIELLNWALQQKRKGVPADIWFPIYEKKYRQESYMATALRGRQFILDLLDKGISVTLVCYCESHCHRFILADIIEELGYTVIKK